MKNKILSYLLGGFFAVLLGLPFGYANASCEENCAKLSDEGMWASCMSSCTKEQEKQQQQGGAKGEKGECKGIKLNTNFPIIGNCIGDNEDATKVFPSMIGALTKIVMSLILVVCFILIIVAGIMWAGDNPGQWKGGGAKGLLAKVAITILLLGFSGVILKLINPNFFNS